MIILKVTKNQGLHAFYEKHILRKAKEGVVEGGGQIELSPPTPLPPHFESVATLPADIEN